MPSQDHNLSLLLHDNGSLLLFELCNEGFKDELGGEGRYGSLGLYWPAQIRYVSKLAFIVS
jgi:hypothetical protein